MGKKVECSHDTLCLGAECITANLCELPSVGVVDVIANGESVVLNNVAYLTIPLKLSDLENDVNYITEADVDIKLSNYSTKEEVANAIAIETANREQAINELSLTLGEQIEQVENDVLTLSDTVGSLSDEVLNLGTTVEQLDLELSTAVSNLETSISQLSIDLHNELATKQSILTPTNGISIDNHNNIGLSTSNLSEISLRDTSETQQNQSKLIIEDATGVKKVAANNLDYSKITVVNSNEEDINNVRLHDFLFTKEN